MKALKTVTKWIGGAALAAAMLFAAPSKANAQVRFGVAIGGPVYRPIARPIYVAPRPVYVAPPPPVEYRPYGYYRPYYRPYYYRPGVSFGVRIR